MERSLHSYELFQDLNTIPSRQRVVAALWRQLDDQSRHLKNKLSKITVDELNWQLVVGSNTVGMLLAHMAITEAYWINVVPLGSAGSVDENSIIKEIVGIGINDDGMPLAPRGLPPQSLRDKTWPDYALMVDRARERTSRTLSSWADDTLSVIVEFEGRRISYGWVLYHLIDHFSWHAGQIMQLRHFWRTLSVAEVQSHPTSR
jgi:uncharacterized damage-inducible protein DinB